MRNLEKKRDDAIIFTDLNTIPCVLEVKQTVLEDSKSVLEYPNKFL